MKTVSRQTALSIRDFFAGNRSVGLTLICCTVLSLIISNSPLGAEYMGFWQKDIGHGGAHHLPASLLHIINDGLMCLFFLMAGLEIRREIAIGELVGLKRSILPAMAALGGMVVPALICYGFTMGTSYARGCGIPMATDVAFSLAVVSLLGNRVPPGLRIFLIALAIIDDLGGIVVIAVFYGGTLHWFFLFAAAALAVLLKLELFKLPARLAFLAGGVALWYFMFNSGIHATIAGVLMAFILPLQDIERLEKRLGTPVNYFVLPLFVFANTALLFEPMSAEDHSAIWLGIFFGLVVGKPLGVMLFSYIAVRLGSTLPASVGWRQLLGVSILAGIGFTISIFISTLAFNDTSVQMAAKLAVLSASIVSGVTGYCILTLASKPPRPINCKLKKAVKKVDQG